MILYIINFNNYIDSVHLLYTIDSIMMLNLLYTMKLLKSFDSVLLSHTIILYIINSMMLPKSIVYNIWTLSMKLLKSINSVHISHTISLNLLCATSLNLLYTMKLLKSIIHNEVVEIYYIQ
jgi:hypothetical protein